MVARSCAEWSAVKAPWVEQSAGENSSIVLCALNNWWTVTRSFWMNHGNSGGAFGEFLLEEEEEQ